ncbi:PHA/PHB synthase family protein [Sphingomonas sp. Leaf231]|uniref:PHA/PHB synthase family protein n=1 Tax=Sphingomonas sp. Leaf231 TaxID=1736301 RepID=UPI0009EA9840|nr:class I poly(R)-hydroxyalkanoic acid synthase [Sphingomonas sp. Leaf231]
MGRAQQMMLESGVPLAPPAQVAEQARDFWTGYLDMWQRFVAPPAADAAERPKEKDRRFANPAWRANPAFDWMRQSYDLIADHMLRSIDALEGVDDRTRAQLRFATTGFVDAMSPSNFAVTNPEVIEKTIETRGQNLLTGLNNMLSDIGKGQLTHTDGTAFEVGRNLAATPGKVVKRTPLYELIQYAPTTETVLATPLVIFPPWINRFYILDLTPEKSFIRWAVAQGVTVFMVSWKSADASMADVAWDDYVAAQIEAVDTIRALLDVPAVHTVGYCVAGTTLAATLALLAARGEADKVASATFLTAQVDFSRAGELLHFVDDEQLKMIGTLSPNGYLDGRYLAMTFNLLRGRDLIWNYVTNNYLLGKDYAPFDLLHWNGDVTNLPAKWHLSYLTDLYRDNRLVEPGAMQVAGVPLDLTTVRTPAYIQAGREDHIAPAESVWKLTHHLRGPQRFVLAGSGHIAGVVNPPAANKYQHWISDAPAESLDDFVAAAREVKGSWWNDWADWLRGRGPDSVAADGARVPGTGALPAIEDAPGSYVRAR